MLGYWKNNKIFPSYLTDLLSNFEWRSLGRQQSSSNSRQELEQFDGVGALLRQLPAPRVPTDLALRIRCRISQERNRAQQVTWRWKLENRLAVFAFPAMAGLLSAVIIFGLLIHTFEIPVQANSQDVPLTLRTPPRLRSSGPVQFANGIQCMEVTILIDQNGRVADFRIVKGKQTPEQVRNLQYLLFFTVFDPATLFGRPTADTVTLDLKDGNLNGVSL